MILTFRANLVHSLPRWSRHGHDSACAGVREGRHLPAGAAAEERGAGPGRVLHHPLRGPLREDRHEDADVRRPAAGGTHTKYFLGFLIRTIVNVMQILTKDSVTVFVNAIMYYKVKDATSAVANVDDYSGSAQLLAATTLRNVLGTRNLGDILSEREAIAQVAGHTEPSLSI